MSNSNKQDVNSPENKSITKPDDTQKKPFNTKKLKYGSVATAVTAVVIAIIVVLNVLVNAIMAKHPLKVDLTSEKLYEITAQTTDYLKNMTQDVEIVVMQDENTYKNNTNLAIIAELLDKYSQYSKHLTVEYVNMEKNPDVVSKYSDKYSGEIAENDIVIYSNDKERVTSAEELFVMKANYTTNSYDVTGINAESVLTADIMYVTDADPKSVAFIDKETHSYVSSAKQTLASILYSNGYDIDTVDIATQDIDAEKYDMVVLFAPLNDLTETEIDKIQTFLDNGNEYGKNMLYVGDLYQNITTNVDAFLNEWGIELGRSMVGESDSSITQNVSLYSFNATVPSATASVVSGEETYSAGLSNTTKTIVAPLARPISLLWETNSQRQTTALLTTPDSCYARPLDMTSDSSDASADFDIDSAEKSAQTVAAVSEKYYYDNTDKFSSKLMVVSSASLLDPNVISSASYNNSEYLMNAVNVMNGKNQALVIEEKAFNTQTIDVTETQVNGIRTVTVIVIPVIVVALGIFVFIRRKNR